MRPGICRDFLIPRGATSIWFNLLQFCVFLRGMVSPDCGGVFFFHSAFPPAFPFICSPCRHLITNDGMIQSFSENLFLFFIGTQFSYREANHHLLAD
jgi:hypothetical protein